MAMMSSIENRNIIAQHEEHHMDMDGLTDGSSEHSPRSKRAQARHDDDDNYSEGGGDGDMDEEQGENEDEHGGMRASSQNDVMPSSMSHEVTAWLQESYQVHNDVSLPRSLVYEHYIEHCNNSSMEPVNSATFGKVIRSVFPALKTRRLGTRGNSKYHYFGIGLKNHVAKTGEVMMMIAKLCNTAVVKPRAPRRSTAAIMQLRGQQQVLAEESYHHHHHHHHRHSQPQIACRRNGSATGKKSPKGGESDDADGYKNLNRDDLLSDFSSVVPNYEEFSRFLEQICLPNYPASALHVPFEHIQGFNLAYQQHICTLLRIICNYEFHLVERTIDSFWRNLSKDYLNCLHSEEIVRIIAIADDYLYQVIIHTLLADTLEPVPIAITQAIRQFAKMLEIWLTQTLTQPIPQIVGEIKLDIARRFCHVLRRRTSLNHLAQAVQSIISNPEHVSQMLTDWCHIDFASIREQSRWILKTKEALLVFVENGFKTYLQENASLHVWAQWIEGLIEQCLALMMASGDNLESAACKLVLRWSFFGTMIMRDLTLRSANAFGSFHLLRLLFDEYLLFYIEKKTDEHRRAVGISAFDSSSLTAAALANSASNAGNNAAGTEEDASNGGAVIDWSQASFQQIMSSDQAQPQISPAAGNGTPSSIITGMRFPSLEELFRRNRGMGTPAAVAIGGGLVTGSDLYGGNGNIMGGGATMAAPKQQHAQENGSDLMAALAGEKAAAGLCNRQGGHSSALGECNS